MSKRYTGLLDEGEDAKRVFRGGPSTTDVQMAEIDDIYLPGTVPFGPAVPRHRRFTRSEPERLENEAFYYRRYHQRRREHQAAMIRAARLAPLIAARRRRLAARSIQRRWRGIAGRRRASAVAYVPARWSRPYHRLSASGREFVNPFF